ncbi:MAG: AbrB/MazE/SpoVT family DNA-binding domain-containing protein [Solirubrobacterales bacterium]|nr:AbrB/MazE/SpoVT family DNA-binding domain-containing protein [Solirubrobacterales bacterium]
MGTEPVATGPACQHAAPLCSAVTPSTLYLDRMTQRMGAKGQVVIPKDLREQAGLGPGADVSFEPMDNGGIVVRRADRHSTLQGRFAGSGMAARLLEDRRREPR